MGRKKSSADLSATESSGLYKVFQASLSTALTTVSGSLLTETILLSVSSGHLNPKWSNLAEFWKKDAAADIWQQQTFKCLLQKNSVPRTELRTESVFGSVLQSPNYQCCWWRKLRNGMMEIFSESEKYCGSEVSFPGSMLAISHWVLLPPQWTKKPVY